MSAELSRRAIIAGGALALATRTASARGRTPYGGRISVRVPWPVASCDPHRLDDPTAAFFGEALFDSLYAPGESSGFVAALAEGDPEPDGANLRVKLRAGLETAKGRHIEPRDVAASIARARSLGARGWLADIPVPRVDGRSLVFAMRDASRLVHALASPLVAIVPPSFAPDAPDGTGPFRFGARGDAVVFSRNPRAARGPAFLDEVVVRAAPNRAASLREFESGADDLGWHGLYLYSPRQGAHAFDLGMVGWAVLFTGRDANDWDAPGVAQRLCDGIMPSRLKEYNLGPAWTADTEQGWGGPPTSLLVRDDAPWLVDLAASLAATISRPSHEVTPKPIPASDLAQRRTSRLHALALDVVRPVAPGGLGAMVSLATADNAGRASEIMLHPPKLAETNARAATRLLRAGVVGELRVQGGRAGDVSLAGANAGAGFDFGGTSRARR